MCGRYYYDGYFRDKLNELMNAEGIAPAGIAPADRTPDAAGRDVFPSDASTVICASKDGLTTAGMYWGFTNPYRKGLIINARAETAAEKKLFSDSIKDRRCIIPASGFYEWDPNKARFRFTSPGGELILLAGFFHDEQGTKRYTILTTEANDSMRHVHDRMPVMIERSEIRAWIADNDYYTEILRRPQQHLACEQDSGQISMML